MKTSEESPGVDEVVRLPAPQRPPISEKPPRFMIIGAGSRGNTYAREIRQSTNGTCVGVADPIAFKRRRLGERYIWGKGTPADGQEFADWRDFLVWEESRRKNAAAGFVVGEAVDGVFICVQDSLHKEVILGLAPLGLHIMCEKPLATSLDDCVSIYRSLLLNDTKKRPSTIFSIGHVLRYSPFNMLLRKLLLEDRMIGGIVSINHTEPVGWWHFSHSYVRGNWRKESTSGPSLLTKSCHDIDLILWLLCSPPPGSSQPAHLPTTVSSSGARQYFTNLRKPAAAGTATNCFSCDFEPSCKFSARRIYLGSKLLGLGAGNVNWPVDIVLPDIEEHIAQGGPEAGEAALAATLKEDYDKSTSPSEIEGKNWYGRCVYEADNDVCDEQVVTMAWDHDTTTDSGKAINQTLAGRGAKTAIFHMVAFTKQMSHRYSIIYGTDGEIHADSNSIVVENFSSGKKKSYYPHLAGGGHGGGDGGLTRQFVLAVDRVKNHGEDVASAQNTYLGCTLEEVIRSHAMVFAAEEARKKGAVVDFPSWWAREVESRLTR